LLLTFICLLSSSKHRVVTKIPQDVSGTWS
jgi:hypothetical protein